MGLKRLGRTLALEGGRLAVLVAVFWFLAGSLQGLRSGGDTDGTALASSPDTQRVSKRDLAPLYAWLEQASAEIADTNTKLEESLLRIDGQRDEVVSLMDQRSRSLEGSFLDRLDSARGRVEEARSAVESQMAQIQQLRAMLNRDPVAMKDRMIRPTVQLRGNGTVGSGVIVYSYPQAKPSPDDRPPAYTTLALTAYHVVLEVLGDVGGTLLEEIQVFESAMDEGETFQARLVAFDESRDIALLRFNSTRKFEHSVDLIASNDLSSVDVFTAVYAVGCPLGNRPLPTVGEISSKSKVVGDQSFWMINAPTFFGNSGGGVYLAKSHQLIGISSMIYTYGKSHPTVVPHMGLFVPLDVIYRWLDAEGYGFVYRREPVPSGRDSLLYRGVRTEGSSARPAAATLRD